jgi:L-asparaginase
VNGVFRRNVLVLYVGGTIGMRSTPQGLAPQSNLPDNLAEKLASVDSVLPDFKVEAFGVPIDSAEATPGDWARIAAHLVVRWNDHEAFVVLHGTDTMAFTASALSFMLRDLAKPIVLTGSQIPLVQKKSDALANVEAALRFASCAPLREVAIAFNDRLYRGNRTTKISTRRYAAFESPNYPTLAGLGPQAFTDHDAFYRPRGEPVFEIPDEMPGVVATPRVVPGLSPAVLDAYLDGKPRALILECYGAGTLPSLDGRMQPFLQQLVGDGTIVVALSQVAHGGLSIDTYASGSALVAAGIVDGRDMTFEAAFTKLHHLFARGGDPQSIRDAMMRDISGEMSLEPATG